MKGSAQQEDAHERCARDDSELVGQRAAQCTALEGFTSFLAAAPRQMYTLNTKA